MFKKHNLKHIRWASHVNSTYLNLTAYLRHLYSSFSYDRSEEKLCSAISPMTSWYLTLKLGKAASKDSNFQPSFHTDGYASFYTNAAKCIHCSEYIELFWFFRIVYCNIPLTNINQTSPSVGTPRAITVRNRTPTTFSYNSTKLLVVGRPHLLSHQRFSDAPLSSMANFVFYTGRFRRTYHQYTNTH